MHDELTRVDIRKMQAELDYRKSEITPKLKEQLKIMAQQMVNLAQTTRE